MFDYDWFHGPAFDQQKAAARWQCALHHFPDVDPADAPRNSEIEKFHDELEERTLIYLRDGFSYEIKHMIEVDAKSHLVFECMPVDEQYKVGAFIVTLPFDEIVRVEVYAVHPTEKPEDLPQITGFRTQADHPDSKFADGKQGKHPKPVKPAR